ncbi:heterokaryon incompatibility protein-domain-containing protein [Apiospora kogelbergensis]|uniref:Heterokaryon incompatibility protein-domain-containing protein n=1 Tax=Apiospora kogelbergensis TaxID=1337665 RepID=A0AAW0QJE0_9PEZI
MEANSDSHESIGIQHIPLYLIHKLDYSKSQIRLLSILPGQKDEEVNCRCYIVDLDDRPVFNALSYVWGDARNKANMMLEGVRIEITNSLAAALSRIRLPHEAVAIWADAVCINQRDPAEKAHQIGVMQKIYSQCSKSLVWMGDISVKGDTGEAAVKAARAALNALRICADEPHDELIGWPGQDPVAVSAGDPAKRPEHHDVFDLFQAGTAMYPPDYLGPFSVPVMSVLQAKHWDEWDVDPLTRLWRFRDRKATNSKDKLFGMWALIKEGSLASIKPSDYSLDVAILFRKVTVDLLRSLNSLKPLIGWRGERVTGGLPSWVLDLVQRDPLESVSGFWTHEIAWDKFDSSRGLPQFRLHRDSDNSDLFLELDGIRVDQVARIVADSRYNESSEWREILERVIGECMSREELLGQFDNLIQGRLDEHHPRVSDPSWGDSWWVDRMLRAQVLFLTCDNRIGVGPPSLKPEDDIWILSGGNHPFLLRSNTSEEGGLRRWELVGDCFVYGIMYGEVTDASKSVIQTQVAIIN